jgi:DNA-binding CsgD family transcriptional regulator
MITTGNHAPVSDVVGSVAAMLVARAGLSPVMVGRDPELARLRRLAQHATSPSIALIGGEPGIGKTRLATELINSVGDDTRVLLCQADPGGLGQPYRLLLDLAGDGHVELIAALRTDDPMVRDRAGMELLRHLVGDGPALLVVDDLHWADPESLAVFEQLDEVTTGALLLVGTYRPDELSRRHPLAAALERLDRRRGVTHLRLERLTVADTARFLAAVHGQVPPRRIVTALHQRTGGNPFFLEELLKAAGNADLERIHTQPLPWNLAEALRSQLDGLAPDMRRVVEAAAVLGARVSFDLLASVTGLDEPALILAMRELVDRGLLVEVEDDLFGFRHALTREAVAGEMLARQRRRLHEAALEALRESPSPDPAAIAVHARGAGRYDDMIAVARRGAAERLAAGSPYGALNLAELALEEAPDDPELRHLAGTAAWRAGYVADARRHATRALEAATDDDQRVAALTQLIRVAWERGELAEMDDYAEQVRRLTDSLPDDEVRARAIAAVAQSYMLRHGPGDPIEWADRAYDAAERLGLKDVRLSALVEKGSALVRRAATADEGRRLLSEVAAEAESAGVYLEAARAWHNLLWYLPGGDPVGPELLERMRANAARAGVAGMAVGAYHLGRAWLAVLDGDLGGAVAVLEQVRRVDRHVTAADAISGAPVMHLGLASSGQLRGRLAELYLERGDLDAAEAVLTESSSPRWRKASAGYAFQIACRRGDTAAARRLLEELTTDARADEPAATALHSQLAAGVAAGLSREELEPLAERAATGATAKEPPHHPVRALVAARFAEAGGRWGEALAGFRQAENGGDPAGTFDLAVSPADRGSAAVGAGRCLVQLGRFDEARAYLTAARRHLARWSGWRCDEVAVLARRLDPPTGGGGDALTPREREVAELLAEGLTNSQIAQRLVISRKTVAVHVSHILAKLEMSSRTQVAAWATRTLSR